MARGTKGWNRRCDTLTMVEGSDDAPRGALCDSREGRFHKRPHQRYRLRKALLVGSTELDVALTRAFQGGAQSLCVLDTTIVKHTRAVLIHGTSSPSSRTWW